jgi:hypothetical protein
MKTVRKKTKKLLKKSSQIVERTRKDIYFAAFAAMLFALSLAAVYALITFFT